MNKLKELANKTAYEIAFLMLDINGMMFKVDKEFMLCQEDKEYYYGIVECYRAGMRHDFGNWKAIKCVTEGLIWILKLRIFRQAVILAAKGKAEEA